MRSALTVLSMLAFSQFACAQDAASAGTSPDVIIVSEFGKFLELELRDCIAGYDSLLSQEKSKAQTGANIQAAEVVMGLMRTALNAKVGEEVPLQTIRETSSFHISGIYLSDADEGAQSDAHLEYQGKVIASCNRQVARIVGQVTGSEGL